MKNIILTQSQSDYLMDLLLGSMDRLVKTVEVPRKEKAEILEGIKAIYTAINQGEAK